MNSRNRFSANEYRSSNTTSSKMSPETLTRSQSLQRSDNSGNYRRFRPRNFQSRRSDLFIEAGRLAVDYLISHGLLPSDVLSTNNGMKKSNISELRDPIPPSVRGKLEQDLIDEGKTSGRLRRKSPARCSSPRGNNVGEDRKDESVVLQANSNDALEIGTVRDVNILKEQEQRDKEDATASNFSKQESNFMEKDSVAPEEKVTDASVSNKSEEDSIKLTATIDISDSATDTACRSELTVPDQNKTLIDRSFAGSASEGNNPVGEDRGEKRALGDEDARDNTKKPKQWLSVSQFHENLQHMGSVSDKSFEGVQDLRPAPLERLGFEAVNQDHSFGGVAMLSKDGATSSTGPSLPYSEKQFFPSSFKICDLNLMEVCDNTNESHDAPALPHAAISVSAKQVPVDVDLSMGSNSSINNEYTKYKVPDKAIDVIDLESDSLHEDRNFHSSIRRTESEFPGSDNFPSHVQSSSYNPDTQDGYGLMISELIGNDIPNCPPVQPETNPLHSEISLHPGDNLLSDDDQIYMTLGDIPITGLMGGWDPPNQDY